MRSKLLPLLLILPVLWALALFDFGIFTGGDNAYYLILSKSIALHHTYADLSLPGNPPATHYPPLLPLILSPLVAIFGHNYIPEKFLILFFFVVSIVSCYHLFRKVSGVKPGSSILSNDLLILILAFAFNFVAVEHSHHILSEIPYLAFSMISIFFFIGYIENKRPWQLYLAILLAVLTFHLRTIGFTLVLAELLVLLKRDRRMFAIGTGISVALAIPWNLRNFLVSGSTSKYLQQFLLRNVYAPELGRITFGDVLRRISVNSSRFSFNIYGELLTSKNVGSIVSVLLLLITLVGIVDGIRRRKSEVIVWYLLFYNVFLLSWHWYDSRYALPVLPLFVFSLYLGFRRITARIRPRFRIPAVLLLVLLLPSIHSGLIELSPRWAGNSAWLSGEKLSPYSKEFRNFFAVAQFAKVSTAEDAVFCSRKPSLFYWFSHRKNIIYPYSSDPKEIRSFFDENHIRYVVLDTFFGTTRAYLLPALKDMGEEVRVIYETPRFPKVYLLEIVQRPS